MVMVIVMVVMVVLGLRISTINIVALTLTMPATLTMTPITEAPGTAAAAMPAMIALTAALPILSKTAIVVFRLMRTRRRQPGGGGGTGVSNVCLVASTLCDDANSSSQ